MINQANIDKLLGKMPEIETQLSDPATASNMKLYRELVREHARLRKLKQKSDRYFHVLGNVQEHRELLESDESDEELRELASEELVQLEEDLPALEKDLLIALLPPDPDDERSAIMEIRAGTGGDEAALFAGDLFRMYNRYAEANSWKVGVIDASSSGVGGYKEVVFSIEGANAYGTLRHEMGVHRVQRVPVTESSGRIHTSAATVAIFPEAEAEDEIDIPADEVRVDIFRSSGPGGQSVNTTDSAVRLTHIPSGITVQCQDEKSQHRNREKAMKVLSARILDLKRREEAEKKGDARRSQIGSGDRSERIRTYNFPQNRLTDHRINLTAYSLDRIMEGELEETITALRDHALSLRLEDELSA